MTPQYAKAVDVEAEDESRVATPTASHVPALTPESSATSSVAAQIDLNGLDLFSSPASALDLSLNLDGFDAPRSSKIMNESAPGPALRLPLPLAPPGAHDIRTVPDTADDGACVELAELPPEIATADLLLASDGSFVETGSGAAARELKRRYDQYLGVSKDIRSPYVITSYTNQHGKQRFRVGHRDAPAPAAASAVDDIDGKTSGPKSPSVVPSSTISSQSSLSVSPSQGKRRSRMSVHSFLPPGVFKNNNASTAMTPPKPPVPDGSRSPPVRKLRKTRSIPNMASPTLPASTASARPSIGRPHAHSVSSADAFRPPHIPSLIAIPKQPTADAFADAMGWNLIPTSPSTSSSILRFSRSFYSPLQQPVELAEEPTDTIQNPFGVGVLFDAPSGRSPSNLGEPPVLREMQSFESCRTARAVPHPHSSGLTALSVRQSDDDLHASEASTPVGSDHEASVDPQPSGPKLEQSLFSRFSSELFDVLQYYKGLPRPDMINFTTATNTSTTVRLSLNDGNAAPRDDPRFVIWGSVEGEGADVSLSRASVADVTSAQSNMSRGKGRQSLTPSDGPSVHISSSESPQKVLVAATIERWIAQLTSELNYDELLLFFLTYRTYISPFDLGQLFICRFHWALAPTTTAHDEMVRRIVRARTFIAIRYWLLMFFSTDFVPNRDLRILFANWLNSLHKDPILTRHRDAPAIVKKLRKVALDCKEAHTGKRQNAEGQTADKAQSPPAPAHMDLSNGNFAEALRKAVGKDHEDDDIDLDFSDAGTTGVDFGISAPTGSKPHTAIDLAMLRQPLHLAFLQHGRHSMLAPQTATTAAAQVPLPVSHSTVSRLVVNAIGRLGRWKRFMNHRTTNARTPLRPPLGFRSTCVDASAFDIEANETGDLLLVRGGVEQYLKMIESRIDQPDNSSQLGRLPPVSVTSPPTSEFSLESVSSNNEPARTSRDSLDPLVEASEEGTNEGQPEAEQTKRNEQPSALQRPQSHASNFFRSSVASKSAIERDSFIGRANGRRQPDVVSIDDLDLSDLSSEDLHLPPPPGLKRLPRKLPNRRDFEFVRHSMDSVSSMGIRTHESVMSGGSSVTSSMSVSGEPALGATIQQWHMNALVDSLSDEDEPGDVEAALRHLEGQINPGQREAKQSKVDAWVQSIRRRGAANMFFNERRRHSNSSDEDYGEVQEANGIEGSPPHPASPSNMSSRNSVSSEILPASAVSSATDGLTPSTQFSNLPTTPTAAPTTVADAKPAVEDAVPPEILQSRVAALVSPSTAPRPLSLNALTTAHDAILPPGKTLKKHRSFILSYRAESLIQHFSVIDRELFLNVKFEELISSECLAPDAGADVLDWVVFLRERARLKAEGRDSIKTSALTVVRGRFNLLANFVISEVVLTHPNERMMVYSKFVRMAWKAYSLKNFHSLVAILAGLSNSWVKKAMAQCPNRIGIWESRMFRDLIQWTTPEDDFKHIRQTIEALSEAKAIPTVPQDASVLSTDGQSTTRSRAASDSKPIAPPACIPFFGVYLSQLHRYSRLPDLIDPTAPHSLVGIDPETHMFLPPAHPEVFSHLTPLPTTVQLEALVNVHKQRLVAGVVKSLVAGQHLASRVSYPVDKKLFQKCLKLRGLDADTLQRALDLYGASV